MSINDLFHININAAVNVTPGFSHGAMTQAQTTRSRFFAYSLFIARLVRARAAAS